MKAQHSIRQPITAIVANSNRQILSQVSSRKNSTKNSNQKTQSRDSLDIQQNLQFDIEKELQKLDDRIVLQQENLSLKQEVQRLKSTIRTLNIQSVNQNYHQLSSDTKKDVYVSPHLVDTSKFMESQNRNVISHKQMPFHNYNDSDFSERKVLASIEKNLRQKQEQQQSYLKPTTSSNQKQKANKQSYKHKRAGSTQIQNQKDQFIRSINSNRHPYIQPEFQPLTSSSVDEPEILANNPMAQSKSCSDLNLMLNFDIDAINIINNLMPQSSKIEDTIKSGEGYIMSSSLKRDNNFMQQQQLPNTQEMTMKKPYLILSSAKNTPDFNKSIGNDTLRTSLYLQSPALENITEMINRKEYQKLSLQKRKNLDEKLKNDAKVSIQMLEQRISEEVKSLKRELSKQSHHSNIIQHQSLRNLQQNQQNQNFLSNNQLNDQKTLLNNLEKQEGQESKKIVIKSQKFSNSSVSTTRNIKTVNQEKSQQKSQQRISSISTVRKQSINLDNYIQKQPNLKVNTQSKNKFVSNRYSSLEVQKQQSTTKKQRTKSNERLNNHHWSIEDCSSKSPICKQQYNLPKSSQKLTNELPLQLNRDLYVVDSNQALRQSQKVTNISRDQFDKTQSPVQLKHHLAQVLKDFTPASLASGIQVQETVISQTSFMSNNYTPIEKYQQQRNDNQQSNSFASTSTGRQKQNIYLQYSRGFRGSTKHQNEGSNTMMKFTEQLLKPVLKRKVHTRMPIQEKNLHNSLILDDFLQQKTIDQRQPANQLQVTTMDSRITPRCIDQYQQLHDSRSKIQNISQSSIAKSNYNSNTTNNYSYLTNNGGRQSGRDVSSRLSHKRKLSQNYQQAPWSNSILNTSKYDNENRQNKRRSSGLSSIDNEAIQKMFNSSKHYLKQKSHSILPSQMIYPVRSPMATVYNHLLYVIGGCRGPKDHLNDIQIYNIEQNSWSLADFKLQKERSCFMLSRIGSEIYIMGGFDGYECIREVEKIDLSQSEQQSIKLKNMSHPVKNGVSYYNQRDGFIYIIGGWDEKETQDKIFKYHPVSQDMHFVGFLPYKVEGHSVTVVDDKWLYIFGGFDSVSVIDTVMRINLQFMSCEALSDVKLSIARENSTCQFDGENLIYVAGGWDGRKSIDDIEIFQVDRQTGNIQKVTKSDNKLQLQSARNRPCSICL
eukprot:403370852